MPEQLARQQRRPISAKCVDQVKTPWDRQGSSAKALQAALAYLSCIDLATADYIDPDAHALAATDIFSSYIVAGLTFSLVFRIGRRRFLSYAVTTALCSPFLYIGMTEAEGLDWIFISLQLAILAVNIYDDARVWFKNRRENES
ncbi:hypothetical protein ACWKSP_22110 [Micromonosporaceae bacterium Da 78-11]